MGGLHRPESRDVAVYIEDQKPGYINQHILIRDPDLWLTRQVSIHKADPNWRFRDDGATYYPIYNDAVARSSWRQIEEREFPLTEQERADISVFKTPWSLIERIVAEVGLPNDRLDFEPVSVSG